MRLFGRASPPRSCPLQLVPVHDVAGDGPGMRSLGSDPFFLLQPGAGGFPTGRCEFVFEALPGTIPLQPVLYLDTGADFNEAQTIRLAGGEAGTYRQVITLPPGLVRLRFDPTALPGPMPLQRARLVPRPTPDPPAHADAYTRWVATYDTLSDADRQQISRHIRHLPERPHFAIWVDGAGDPAAFARTAESLDQQLYPHWQGRLPQGCAVTRAQRARWAADPAGGFVLLLQAGDVLAPHALYRLALAVAAAPGASALVLDDDRLDPQTGARHTPRFRAAWSPDAAPAPNPGPLLARRDALATAAGAPDLLHPLSQHGAIGHVPGVLVHRTGADPAPVTAARPAPLAPQPLVSVIIPTRDGLALLRTTVTGVLERTDYPNLELIIIDNGSTEPALSYLAALANDPRVRVLPSPGPFNYAALNNAGVAAASGEILALLNNDLDIIAPGWLAEMVAHALRPTTGAVGCKLLYADGTVQHAGVVTGMRGLAGHPFRGQDGAAPGYLGLLTGVRNVSAVTGACLVMRRARYLEVGGLDAAELAVSYNDVDLCLKLRQAGYRNVWTPFACLYHLESVTRGADSHPDNAARAQREHDALLRRWGATLLHDPYYSPCLTIEDESYGLAWPPRLAEPWRSLDDP